MTPSSQLLRLGEYGCGKILAIYFQENMKIYATPMGDGLSLGMGWAPAPTRIALSGGVIPALVERGGCSTSKRPRPLKASCVIRPAKPHSQTAGRRLPASARPSGRRCGACRSRSAAGRRGGSVRECGGCRSGRRRRGGGAVVAINRCAAAEDLGRVGGFDVSRRGEAHLPSRRCSSGAMCSSMIRTGITQSSGW
jgi:hypothetical protein